MVPILDQCVNAMKNTDHLKQITEDYLKANDIVDTLKQNRILRFNNNFENSDSESDSDSSDDDRQKMIISIENPLKVSFDYQNKNMEDMDANQHHDMYVNMFLNSKEKKKQMKLDKIRAEEKIAREDSQKLLNLIYLINDKDTPLTNGNKIYDDRQAEINQCA